VAKAILPSLVTFMSLFSIVVGPRRSHLTGKGKDGNPMDATMRITDVLRKSSGKWLIVHEHVSVPVDLASGKADLSSKP
jgi:hypothetical protein